MMGSRPVLWRNITSSKAIIQTVFLGTLRHAFRLSSHDGRRGKVADDIVEEERGAETVIPALLATATKLVGTRRESSCC